MGQRLRDRMRAKANSLSAGQHAAGGGLVFILGTKDVMAKVS